MSINRLGRTTTWETYESKDYPSREEMSEVARTQRGTRRSNEGTSRYSVY